MTQAINEQTKFMRICQLADRRFPDKREATAAVKYLLDTLHVLLRTGDLTESSLSVDTLTGKSKNEAREALVLWSARSVTVVRLAARIGCTVCVVE